MLPIQRSTDLGLAAGAPGSRFLRAERCYSIPGDSAIRLRLPPTATPGEKRSRPPVDLTAPDQTQPFTRLPAHREISRLFQGKRPAAGAERRLADGDWFEMPARTIASARHAAWHVRIGRLDHRTAMCAEFAGIVPSSCRPLAALDHYLELVAAVRRLPPNWPAGDSRRLAEPPRDPRLEHLCAPTPVLGQRNRRRTGANWSSNTHLPLRLRHTSRG